MSHPPMSRFLWMVPALCLLTVCASDAATFYYPKQESALFSIEVPDDWKPEVLDDGSLEAYSPDDKGYLNSWILKDREDFDSLDKDLNDLLEPWLKNIKLSGDAETIKSEHTEFQVYSGTGTDKEDGSSQGFEIFLFKITDGQVGVFFIQYAADAPKETIDELVAVAKSIKLAD